jgi:hypothetical protein
MDISDYVKSMFDEINKNNLEKQAVTAKTYKFALSIISKEKIDKYVEEIKKMIAIDKRDDPEWIEALEITNCIQVILMDLKEHLEQINESHLSKSDREFIKNHLDIFFQVVIVIAIDNIEDKNIIDKKVLLQILSIVRLLTLVAVNLKVQNCFSCCKKQ